MVNNGREIRTLKSRRQARIIALQALYEIDCASHPPAVVLHRRLSENRLPTPYAEFARHLVEGVLKHRDVLDGFIHEHAPEWPLEQMAYIDRNILRMAIFEFAIDGSTPIKVAINEAVELAKRFGSDSAPRFVNGVLGSLVKQREAIADAAQNFERKP
jgi:N utilization substance protein B